MDTWPYKNACEIHFVIVHRVSFSVIFGNVFNIIFLNVSSHMVIQTILFSDCE